MLLSKAVLSLAKLTDQEQSRYTLDCINLEPGSATVTNGHYLVNVGTGSLADQDKEYPTLPAEPQTITGSILIARDAALGALKAIKALGKRLRHLPILQNAALCADQKLYVNSTDSLSAFDSKAEGMFPKWRDVMPKGKPVAEVTVSAQYLRLLADYVAEHCTEHTAAHVRITVYGETCPVRFDARTTDGADVVAVLMPMRTESSQFAARPDQEPAKLQAA